LTYTFFELVGVFSAWIAAVSTSSWALVKVFLEKKIERKNSEFLERIKHENEVALQSLKAQVEITVGASRILYEREIEVISSLWIKCQASMVAAKRYVGPFESLHSIANANEDQARRVLDQLGLSESHVSRVLEAQDRDDELLTVLRLKKRQRAFECFEDFKYSLGNDGIFLEGSMYSDFETVLVSVGEAIRGKRAADRRKGTAKLKDWNEALDVLERKVDPNLRALRSEIFSRLKLSKQTDSKK